MENTSPILCTKCKSPDIAPKCDAELFDSREIPLCKNCQNWYNDRSQGISRDAKSLALYFMNKNIPVQILDKSDKDESQNYEIVMHYDLNNEGLETVYATFKPSKIVDKTSDPRMTSGTLTFRLPNKFSDLFVGDDYIPNELIKIFNKAKGHGY